MAKIVNLWVCDAQYCTFLENQLHVFGVMLCCLTRKCWGSRYQLLHTRRTKTCPLPTPGPYPVQQHRYPVDMRLALLPGNFSGSILESIIDEREPGTLVPKRRLGTQENELHFPLRWDWATDQCHRHSALCGDFTRHLKGSGFSLRKRRRNANAHRRRRVCTWVNHRSVLTVLIHFLRVLHLAYSVQYFNKKLTYPEKAMLIRFANNSIEVKKNLDSTEWIYEIE